MINSEMTFDYSEVVQKLSEPLRKKVERSIDLLRKAEKLERVKSLMKDEAKVKGEGMKDSLKDLANYAILTIMELERKEEK